MLGLYFPLEIVCGLNRNIIRHPLSEAEYKNIADPIAMPLGIVPYIYNMNMSHINQLVKGYFLPKIEEKFGYLEWSFCARC